MTADSKPAITTRKLAFVGHRQQIAEWAALAGRLRETASVRSDLWVLDEYDRREGLEVGVFDRVVYILDGFRRGTSDPVEYEFALKQLAELEVEDGRPWFHEDAASDRSLTGATDLGVALHRITNRWNRFDVTMMAAHIHQVVAYEVGRNAIGAVIGETNTLPYRTIYRSAVRAGATHLRPESPGHLDGRVHFEDHLEVCWTSAVEKYRSYSAEPIPDDARRWAEKRLSDIRDHHLKPTYSRTARRGSRRFWERFGLATITTSLSAWWTARKPESFSSPRGVAPEVITPLAKLRRSAALEMRRRYYERITVSVMPSEAFAAYFLHVQPEFTVDNLGFAYQDQVAHVRNLVASLPADTVLVVKEHQPVAGTRSLDYYAELFSIPNVVILHDSIDSIDIIKRAKLVFTLTGTVALEAMCVGCPVVLFGDIYYDEFEGVYRARSLSELRELLSSPVRLRAASTEDAVRALAARYAASYPGVWPSAPQDHEAVACLSSALLADLYSRGALEAGS